MSSGFAGSSTRQFGGSEREVESSEKKARKRSLKKLDVFTDQFDPPGVSDAEPGRDYRKGNGGYQKPHDDFAPEADTSFVHMDAAGNAKDQEPMDRLDEIEQRYQARIKPVKDQFPGSKL